MARIAAMLLLLVLPAVAADVAGTWKGSAETPNGTIERTFVFKVDGSKLTGEARSEMFGTSVIENGKVEGSSLSFQIKVKFQDNEMTVSYKGKLDGETLNLTATGVGDMVLEYKCKRQ
jgi:hypothetical protein